LPAIGCEAAAIQTTQLSCGNAQTCSATASRSIAGKPRSYKGVLYRNKKPGGFGPPGS